MDEGASDKRHPKEILGRRVLGVCSECDGEGLLWGHDGETHWADRCNACNCVGFILDMPLDPPAHSDQDDIPF